MKEMHLHLPWRVRHWKASYLMRHPVRGPKNLLALRGIASLLKTRTAAITAGVAAGAAAVPMALRLRKKSGS